MQFQADYELGDFEGMFADSREKAYPNTRPYPAGKKVIIRRSDVLNNANIRETIKRINASIAGLKKVVVRTVDSPNVFVQSTFRDDEYKVVTFLTDKSGGTTYIRNIHINPIPSYGFMPKCNYYVVVYEDRNKDDDDEITIVSADQLTFFF